MNKKYLLLTVIIAVVVVVFVSFMLVKDSQAAEYDIQDGTLIIDTAFGVDVPVSQMKNLALTNDAPVVLTRTNGAGVGSVNKGEFLLEGDVKARIYADVEKPPFIKFTYDGTVFYLNADTAEETEALFGQLKGLG